MFGLAKTDGWRRRLVANIVVLITHLNEIRVLYENFVGKYESTESSSRANCGPARGLTVPGTGAGRSTYRCSEVQVLVRYT